MIIMGDINSDGKVDAYDWAVLDVATEHPNMLSADAFTAADINRDGQLNNKDLVRLSRHILGVSIITEVIE